MMFKSRLLPLFFALFNLLLAKDLLAQTPENPGDNFSNKPVVSVGGFINTAGAGRSEAEAFGGDRLPDAEVTTGIVNESTGSKNHYSNGVDFANDSEIHIKVGGINEFGMKYGAVVELEADVSTDGRDEGFNADKSYIFTESGFGRFEFGNNVAANQKMKVGPSTFARAAGGINGKYLEYINLPMLADSTQASVSQIGTCNGFRVTSSDVVQEFNGGSQSANGSCSKIKLPRFILIPQSPVAHGGYAKGFYNRTTDNNYNNTVASESLGFNEGADGSFGEMEDATKISYFTPRIFGWQLGASFTPDSGNSGSSASISGDNSGDVKNVITWGTNFSNSFGNLGVALSVTGEMGKAEQSRKNLVNTTPERDDLSSYDVGVMATYFGFTVGGSYGSWGSSLMPKSGIYSCQYDQNVGINDQDCDTTTTPAVIAAGQTEKINKFDDATYWTAGLAYQFGPVALSATHLNSEFQDNQYSATSIGVDYRMAKGLMPYLEVTKFAFESKHASYYSGTAVVNQDQLDASKQQIKDNDGYVILTGLLFSF